jgi:hypothetical protein
MDVGIRYGDGPGNFGDSALNSRRFSVAIANCVASLASEISQHGRDKITRRANHPKPVQPRCEKYFCFSEMQIRLLIWPSHPRRGAARDRHERAVGCGGRGCCDGRARLTRTAKACGSGARRWRQVREKQASRGRWWQKSPAHQGERAISRKTIAQGRPDALRFTCMLVCAFPCAHCTRDRGCSAHPAFPAPSVFKGVPLTASLGRIAPREGGVAFAYFSFPSPPRRAMRIAAARSR